MNSDFMNKREMVRNGIMELWNFILEEKLLEIV
jgi:hypothetical protein